MIAGYLPCEGPNCSNAMPICLDRNNTAGLEVMCGQCGHLHYVYPNVLAANVWNNSDYTSRTFGLFEFISKFFNR
jgi:hypothetical protein